MNRPIHYELLLVVAAAVLCGPLFASPAPAPVPSNHASQGYLGIDLRDVSEDQVSTLKLRDNHGAEIILVDHDAPAGKAGLREHDIVLQLNGQPVANQDQARRMLHDCAPGRTVVLTVSRDGQLMPFTARMSTRDEVERRAWEQHIPVPEPQDGAPSEAVGNASGAGTQPTPAPAIRGGNSFIGSILMNPSYTGAMLEQLSTQLAQFFGVPSGAGLLVRSVVDSSPAAQAGMRAGDVIVRVNNKPIASTGDWSKAVKSSHGRPVSVAVLRDKKEQTLTLTPDGKRRSALEELVEAPERTVMAHLNLSWLPGR